jgi:hypothetical protein
MNIGASIGNLIKVALVLGGIYAFVNWEFMESQDDDVREFAEKACIDEIEDRFDTSTVRIYAVNDTNNGYVIRATVTLARGNTAKVYCLTNTNGGVNEITIEER